MGAIPAGVQLVAQNIHSARDAWLGWYGFLATTSPIESDVSATTAPKPIGLWANTRLGFIISNTGSGNVAIGFSASVTITAGILLLQGQTFSSNWRQDGEAVFAPMWVVAASTGTVHIVENVLQGG